MSDPDPSCYALLLCLGSTLDYERHTLSLFDISNALDVPRSRLGDACRVQVHAYWTLPEDTLPGDFEFRVVRTRDGGPDEPGAAFPILNNRIRTTGFRLPSAEGAWVLRVEWRRTGATTEWTRARARWPLTIHLIPKDETKETA